MSTPLSNEDRTLERYETLGDLYYSRYHRLRPGKYEAPETGRDSCDDENYAQFSAWVKAQALNDALDRIAELFKRVETLENNDE